MAILHLENQAYKEKSKVLENQIISNHEQYNEIIIDMQNKNQYLELKYDDILKENLAKDSSQSIISNFEKNFSTILEKFSNIKENFFEQTPTKYTDENLMNFKFLKYLFEKFEDDNMWLIGKLKELTEENTVLTEKMNVNIKDFQTKLFEKAYFLKLIF